MDYLRTHIPHSSGRGKKDVGWREVWIDNLMKNKRFKSNRVTNTKYTPLTFLPKNLLEQFNRFMNRYFLLIACLQLIHNLTPVSPATTWFPLLFIFAVSAIKEALDDYQRHKSDEIANARVYSVFRGSTEFRLASKDIRIGDIVRVDGDCEVPCDLVLIKSSDKDGLCYIETANVDGETDLKSRNVPARFSVESFKDCGAARMRIQCPHPNNQIYAFDATLTADTPDGSTVVYSLDPKNLLLQGTFVRNTGFVYGVAAYTGGETKLGMNKKTPRTKLTRLDILIDRGCVFIFSVQILLVILFGVAGNVLTDSEFIDRHLYIDNGPFFTEWYSYFLIPGRMLLLLSFMIPISLKVSLDIVKYLSAMFINWDLKMYHAETDQPAEAANTSIAEDLGQVQYLFTDKTGTLTENSMLFRRCSVAGEIYGVDGHNRDIAQDSDLLNRLKDAVPGASDHLYDFCLCLALCHSVVPTDKDGDIVYCGSSPDEEALVSTSAALGFVFKGKVSDELTLDIRGELKQYSVLHMLEFTSDRKRMSVIVREGATGDIYIFSKGADDVILESCVDDEYRDVSIDHLEEFAVVGHRTLCVASRKISEKEYGEWSHLFHLANTAMDNRESRLQKCYSRMESGLTLLGITAIEDSLQKDVPQTIDILRRAGIRIWMLTGDKRGTAVQIARTCNLIYEDTVEHKLHLHAHGKSYVELKLEIDDFMVHYSHVVDGTVSRAKYAVIVDGETLQRIFENEACTDSFMDLSMQASSVVCCRVSPHQKSAVVELVKLKNLITLAIGDGGNDVAMIQSAQVGVGIKGREGFQAARAADYSIGQFSYLARLILIHGRYSYKRTAFVALYCIYKSIYMGLIQALYEFYCGFTGTSFFSAYALSSYNVFFTGLPIIFYVLDKDISEESVFKFPMIYQENVSGIFFNASIFIQWIARALFQAIVTFMLSAHLFGDHIAVGRGPSVDAMTTSMLAYSCAIFIQSITIFFASSSLTLLNSIAIGGSVVFFFVLTSIIAAFPGLGTFGINESLFGDPNYMALIIIICTTAVAPLLVLKYTRFNYAPRFFEKIQALELGLYQDQKNADIEMATSSSSESDDDENRKLTSGPSPVKYQQTEAGSSASAEAANELRPLPSSGKSKRSKKNRTSSISSTASKAPLIF